ncbi:MAG: hypothetical protein R3C20_04705 [Planctomycetaceae bacterium]
MASETPNPPEGSTILLHENSAQRLVIVIPPGGRRGRALGWFAVFWLLITTAIACGFFFAEKPGGKQLILLTLFFGAFYAVGVGMIVAWFRMRFTQVMLAVQPNLLSIQRSLAGRKKFTELELGEGAHAQLEESYEQNNEPVYRVAVYGVNDRKECFGTALEVAEKEWLVTVINQFLNWDGGLYGEEALARAASIETNSILQDGISDLEEHSSITQRPPELCPEDLPPDSRVRIDSFDAHDLAISYPVAVPLIFRAIGTPFLAFFCVFWYGVVGTMAVGILKSQELNLFTIAMLAFLSIFVIVGLMPLGMLLALWFGRVTIRVNRDKLTGGVGVGWFRKRLSVSTDSVTDIGIGSAITLNPKESGDRRRPSATKSRGVILDSTERKIPLTFSDDDTFNNEVAGLVRYQLELLGARLKEPQRFAVDESD